MTSKNEEDHSLSTHFERWAKDFEDFNNELAGRDVGRVHRFFKEKDSLEHCPKKRREREDLDMHLTVLEIMRQDAEYRAAHNDLIRFLGDVAREADDAVIALSLSLEQLSEDWQAMLGAAPQLSEEQYLFRDKQGRVRDQNGDIVPGLMADDVTWPKDAPTYEEWEELNTRITSTQERLNGWLDFRDNHIALAQERMTDEDNPLSIQEMQEILKDQQTRVEALRQAQSIEFELDVPAIKAPTNLIEPSI